MKQLKELIAASTAAGLRCLLIGGHAMIAYGYERNTSDLDLLINEESSAAWRGLLSELGYEVVYETNAFLQFRAPEGSQPLDLMIVDEATWRKLTVAAIGQQHGGAEVRLPKPLHLAALKLHALKNNPYRRQDLLDIGKLIELKQIDVRSEEFRDIVVRYLSREAYERFVKDHSNA